MRRRRRINNRKRGAAGNKWLILAVPALVLGLALLLSPGERKQKPIKQGRTPTANFVQGKHWDYFVKDSLLLLIKEVDPGGRYAQVNADADSVHVLLADGGRNERARIVMLRNRPLSSLRELVGEAGVFAVRESGPGAGLHLPIVRKGAIDLIPAPYDMIAGLMDEKAN